MEILLAQPTMRRCEEFLAAVARSRKLHGSWVSPPRTRAQFAKNVARFRTPAHIGYWIMTDSDQIAGAIHINEIVRGSFKSGYLGYYALAPYHRQGYMTRGLQAVIQLAFGRLPLHRLEANIQPGNEPSRRLAQRCGFQLEGFSPRYLKIAGRWRDHERWALSVETWQQLSRNR